MTLIDANILIYAVDRLSPNHGRANTWLTDRLNGHGRTAIAWESITAFVRITTHPRATPHPLQSAAAWSFVEDWLAADGVWVPVPTDRHADVLGDLVKRYRIAGNLIPDAHLAAIAIEHGLEIFSADTDFARFTEVTWRNPLTD